MLHMCMLGKLHTWEVDEEAELLVPLGAAAVPHHPRLLAHPCPHAQPAAANAAEECLDRQVML